MRIRFNSRQQHNRNTMSGANHAIQKAPLPPNPKCEQISREESTEACTESIITEPVKKTMPCSTHKHDADLSFNKPIIKLPFCSLYCEDILLLALIMVLLNENCSEILLLALVYIFISGLEK